MKNIIRFSLSLLFVGAMGALVNTASAQTAVKVGSKTVSGNTVSYEMTLDQKWEGAQFQASEMPGALKSITVKADGVTVIAEMQSGTNLTDQDVLAMVTEQFRKKSEAATRTSPPELKENGNVEISR